MSAERQLYHSFLVRLWQPGMDSRSVWYAMVENPHTGEKRYFPSLTALFRFFEVLLDPRDLSPPPESDLPPGGPNQGDHP